METKNQSNRAQEYLDPQIKIITIKANQVVCQSVPSNSLEGWEYNEDEL